MKYQANPVTPGYIYALDAPNDVLNFYLFPDEMEMELTNGGASELHPSYGHSISQLTGRGSPSFSYSLLFDGVEPTHHLYTGQNANGDRSSLYRLPWQGTANTAPGYIDQSYNPAHLAYRWLMRHIGPEGTDVNRHRAKVFMMRLWEPKPVMVRFSGVSLKPLVISSSTNNEGIIRRFRASMKGEYFYPVVVDRRPFAKRRGGKARKKADETNPVGIVVWDGQSDQIPGDDADDPLSGKRMADIGSTYTPPTWAEPSGMVPYIANPAKPGGRVDEELTNRPYSGGNPQWMDGRPRPPISHYSGVTGLIVTRGE